MNGGTIQRVIGRRIGKMTAGTIRKIARVNGTTIKMPICCRLESKFESAEQR